MPAVTQDYLGPAYATAGEAFSAVLEVSADTALTVQTLTVAVRDSAGNNQDFHGAHNVVITQAGYTLTTAAKSFNAGTYTIFGAYQEGGIWYNLPSAIMVIGSP
ncbi:hypothetical protein [Streptomyces roseochromogenus]|uniref:Bacterial Ig-like domain-containing protein n=1 Tax=Streptomyces roseochromogenus subsp. oscitans DS 12.976 TaxID=1352936 RepID=V6KVM8_STRRC|nr:hypothetical protein [Streptomyces roseochromogenus]EST35496.1 hypothetical protein M878_05395 [Streptomyces roseochromogenus subsp. oscitans DS 12.976]